ncbi:hypothetical protein BKA82DRAFT_997853 [Pisolithus tinctorius]|uniref:Uncharacterized protein n=1 Tax=Pisolithus tinctorius Marx 270 TaxID=870435 RepID=A0A0C3P3U3_PISTI|nr:hypothetical protein BKA82DRAFT_997853 [Pisolithus tinctorius]KIO07710.1 hypothetical protein M404DRAFT_997853 [Pisolithus tinctorius Marx 270]
MQTQFTQKLIHSTAFPSKWVSPSSHINLVGSFKLSMVETDRSVAERARTIVVDSIKACAIDDGELVTAGLKFADKIDTGRLAKKKVIQIRKGEVTMFK